MNVNEFCTKVNLPKFCARLGLEGYSFVKLPTFGWYAHNSDMTHIANIFDLVKHEERIKLYELVTKDRREYLDFEINYSVFTEAKFINTYTTFALWQVAFNFACTEFESYKVTYQGKKVLLKTVLEENGFGWITKHKVGVITNNLKRKFDMLKEFNIDNKNDLGMLLIPTYYTPKHIATIEACDWRDPTKLYPIYNDNEKGWYGNIAAENIVSLPVDLWTGDGFTWDYKCDYWTNGKIKKIGAGMYVDTLVNIWVESANTAFDKAPLDAIIEQGKVEQLKDYVSKLNITKIEEVEEKTGVKLTDCWKKARESQLKLGKNTYVRRESAYYQRDNRSGELIPLTNFAVDVTKIIKRGDKFFRHATIHIGRRSVDVELNDTCFHNFPRFAKALREAALQAGLGITVWYTTQGQQTLNAIESFNSIDVHMEIEVQEAKDNDDAEVTILQPQQP